MESSGLLFQSRHRFVRVNSFKVSLEWPHLLDGYCPLQLCVHGRILRTSDSGTAVAAMKHELRTARRTVLAEPIPTTPEP